MHIISCRIFSMSGFLGLLCALAGSPAVAQEYRWSNIGPDGAVVTAIAIDPRTPATAYAGTFGAGPLKTTDGGATWTNSMQITDVLSIAVDPLNPSTVYAATGSGIHKSVDAGMTWASANSGLPSFAGLRTLAFAPDPANPGVVYAVTGTGIYKSTDGATNWSPTSLQIALDWSPPIASASLAIDPADPSRLYAVIALETNSQGYLYRSLDAGKHWDEVYVVPFGAAESPTAVVSSRSSHYVALDNGRLSASSDGGATWSQRDLPAQDLSTLTLDPAASATIYVGTRSGSVYRSADGGGNWTLVASGMQSVNAVGVVGTVPSTLLIGAENGIYRSPNGTTDLARVHLGTRTLPVNLIVTDPATPSTIYAATPGAVTKTTDGGATWFDSEAGLSGRAIRRLAIDPTTPSTLYASAYWPVNGTGPSVFKSSDAAASWTPASTGLPAMGAPLLAIAPSRPTTLYAGGYLNSLWKSSDGAASWSAVYTSLPADATAIAVDPLDSETVYVTSRSTFFVSSDPNVQPQECKAPSVLKSTNGGTQFGQVWTTPHASSCYIPDLGSLLFDPSAPGIVYAFGSVMIRSVDRGETWDYFSFPGLEGAGIYDVAIDPNPPGRILASTGAGLALGDRGSSSWRYIGYDEGQTLSVDRTGVFRAAGLNGLYEYRLSDTPPSTGCFRIDSGITGTWSNPTQPDHVFMLQLLPTGQLLAMWFVYAPPGGQSWIFALGSVSGDQATLQGTQSSGVGARFPPNLDTANVQNTPWGTLTFRFSDCNHGHVDWTSTVPGYSSGGIDLTRLTLPIGLACPR